MLNEWLTVPQVMRILDCTRQHVSQLCIDVWSLEKPPRAVKFKGKSKMQWLIDPEAVTEYDEMRKTREKYKYQR